MAILNEKNPVSVTEDPERCVCTSLEQIEANDRAYVERLRNLKTGQKFLNLK